MDDNNFVDAVVVGGGAAGLSGAVALARSRRTVLVVDAGEPRNAPAAGVHNYLGREGAPPAELLADGRAELASYGGQVSAGRVVAARPWDREGTGFVVSLDDGREVAARRLLVTTGLVDELPDVPGLAGGGAATCCTAPTATAGRSATGRSASCGADRCRCTRRCCSASSATTS